MRAAAPLQRAAALGLTATLGVLGLSAWPAGAGAARAAVPTGATGQPAQPDRSNVGATHSPQVLRQLAGPVRRGIAGAIPPAQGVDVASFQHPGGAAINWLDVATAGIKFAAVKATEGTYYQNPYALKDLAQAKAAGLAVIAYAFAIPDGNGAAPGSSSPVAQADYLLSYLGPDSSTVPIMLDIEYQPSSYGSNECYGLSPSAMVSWISGFDAEVQRKTGRLPIIYAPTAASPSWWTTCTGGSTKFSQLPLWLPDYTTNASPASPQPAWATWSLWQYSSTGTVSGIDDAGHTDLDRLNPAVLALLDPGNQRAVAGRAIDWQLRRAVPIPGQRPSFSASGLPADVSVSSGGLVTGWADRPGTYQVRVSVTGGQAAAGSVSFRWRVKPAHDTGPTGHVRLHKGGKCLHDAGDRTANGAPVSIWRCNGSAAQRWTVVKDDTIRINGKCMAVSRSSANGTAVDLHTCTGGAAQRWQVRSRGRLVNPASGKCLADPGGSTRNGTRTRIRPCTGQANQQWTLPPGPVVSQIPGKCVDDSGNSRATGTPVDLSACDGSAAQAWRARPDGTLRIHRRCMAVSHAGAGSGAPVDLRACSGGRSQRWRVIADQAGVRLVNRASGLCLADPGDATTNGAQLEVATCDAGHPGMIWRIH